MATVLLFDQTVTTGKDIKKSETVYIAGENANSAATANNNVTTAN